MGDVFKEYLVKHKNNPKEAVQQVGLWVVAIFICFMGTIIPGVNKFAPFLIILVIWGAYILNRRYRKEYEYVITNGDLDVDVIYAENKRKKAVNVYIKDFQVMAPSESKEFANEFKKATKVVDASEGGSTPSYSAVFEQGGRIVRLIWSPDEEMLKTVKMYAPRQTHFRA